MSRRAERVGNLVREEISMLLLREIQDPRIQWVTLTAVKMSLDLRQARVFFTIMGTEEERQRSLQGLKRIAHSVSRHLGKNLRLRYSPEVIFVYDEVEEQARRIDTLLDQIRKEGSDSTEEEGEV